MPTSVYHMEDVLRVYQMPYDQRYPVVCMDEASKQLIGEVNAPCTLRGGRVKCEDYEYERKGCAISLCVANRCEDGSHVRVTARRTKRDWAGSASVSWSMCIIPRPPACVWCSITSTPIQGIPVASAFPPDEARRLLDRLEFHHTPKHASWLNMAEIEIGVLHWSVPRSPTGQRRLVAQRDQRVGRTA